MGMLPLILYLLVDFPFSLYPESIIFTGIFISAAVALVLILPQRHRWATLAVAFFANHLSVLFFVNLWIGPSIVLLFSIVSILIPVYHAITYSRLLWKNSVTEVMNQIRGFSLETSIERALHLKSREYPALQAKVASWLLDSRFLLALQFMLLICIFLPPIFGTLLILSIVFTIVTSMAAILTNMLVIASVKHRLNTYLHRNKIS
ncbi:MAG: hypothetical protein CVV45_17705 [Spirochaetae bacterium HGW-Spirochaetae-10]|nr:MAG: hypothetical protein CVV45_17705 [Spirochaetae bacterium HGW-Spirochaetae-10]